MEWNTNKLRAAGLTLLAAFALMACGGATTSTSAPTAALPASTAAATSATPASAPTAASNLSTDAPTAASDAATAPADTTAATAPAASTSAAATNTKLNLNEVTEDQLMSAIPGFSARMVREFQEYRPYVSI